jgi:hypothetical protein
VRVAASNPLAQLNDGSSMPRLDFGVFQVPPERTVEAVGSAVRADTALWIRLRLTAKNARSGKRPVEADSAGTTCL